MSRQANKIVAQTVESLNDLLDADLRADQLFGLSVEGLTVLDAINSILTVIAEGATIVAARETDGTLVGFVPKRRKQNAAQQAVGDGGCLRDEVRPHGSV